jgi:hypothetical protein
LTAGPNGVYLYNCTDDIYSMMNMISMIAQGFGMLATAFAFLGALMPVGKLIDV